MEVWATSNSDSILIIPDQAIFPSFKTEQMEYTWGIHSTHPGDAFDKNAVLLEIIPVGRNGEIKLVGKAIYLPKKLASRQLLELLRQELNPTWNW